MRTLHSSRFTEDVKYIILLTLIFPRLTLHYASRSKPLHVFFFFFFFLFDKFYGIVVAQLTHYVGLNRLLHLLAAKGAVFVLLSLFVNRLVFLFVFISLIRMRSKRDIKMVGCVRRGVQSSELSVGV